MTEILVCPACGQRAGERILRGLPAYEGFKMAERGEVVLGGCVIEPDQPDHRCRSCRYEWRAKADSG